MIAEADDTQIDIVTEPAVWRQAIARAIKEAGETSRAPISVAKRDLALKWIKGERLRGGVDEDGKPLTRRVRRFFLSFKETCELAGLDHANVYEYAFDVISAAPTVPVARMTVPTLADLALNPPKLAAPAPAPKPKRTPRPAQRRTGLPTGMHNARLITFNGRTLTLSAWAREIGIAMPTLSRRLNAGWTIEATLTCPVISSNPVKPKEAGPVGGKPRVFLTYNGKTQALFEWADETGIGISTLWFRVRSGWSDKDVLTTPVGARKTHKLSIEATEQHRGVGQNFSESAPDRSAPVARYTA